MVLILAAVIAVVVLVMSNWMQGPTLPEAITPLTLPPAAPPTPQ
jgi:hypothetical protein